MHPGIYQGITADDYHSGPGYSKSQLDLVRQAPGLIQWARRSPYTHSDAADIGHAVHCLLLEPAEFTDRYVIEPVFNRRSNAGKEDAERFARENRGRQIISTEDADTINNMHASVMAHPEARALLAMPGESESSVYWIDPATGLLCRCRPDRWARPSRIMIDVKTTDDAAKFHWSVRDYRYDVQAAFYSDGAAAVGEPVDLFVFLVVGKRREMGRYPVRVIELQPSCIDRGRIDYRHDLQAVAECERTGTWPGVELMNVPERRAY
jgi:exodeoxyribonuclease VIII